MSLWGEFVGSLQSAAATSRSMSRFVVRLKGQCDSIIGRRLNSGIDFQTNGEGWLADRVAPAASMFMDVGANVGAWSLHFARRMHTPKGLLFEPAPATLEELRQTIAKAQLPGLDIIGAAVGDVAGNATFNAEPQFGETSSLVAGHSRKGATTVNVPIVTLDEVAAARNIGTVDMLKIDAEGYDLRVLLGARGLLSRQAIKIIQFEYNAPWARAGSTLAAAYSLLEENGYRVRVLRHDGLWDFDPNTVGEFYRYANFVAWAPGLGAAGLDGQHAKLL